MSMKFEKGMKTREAVLGSGYLDKVKENISKFDKNFKNLSLNMSGVQFGQMIISQKEKDLC